MSMTNILLTGGAISFAGIVVHQVAGIVLRVVLARILPPNEFGIVSIGLSVMVVVASFALMGYAQGITRFIGFYSGCGEKGRIKSIILSVLIFVILSGMASYFVVYILAKEVSLVFFHDKALIKVLRIFAIGIPFLAIAKVFNGALRGLKKIGHMTVTDRILWRLFPLLCFTVLYSLYGLRMEGAAYSFVLSAIVMSAVAGVFLLKEIKNYPGNAKEKRGSFKEITKYSLPLSVFNITNQLKGRADIFLVGFFLGPTEVAMFAVASVLASVLNMFLSSVVTVYNPVASELYGGRDLQQLGRIFSLSTKWIFLFTFPLFLFLIFFSETSIHILFGNGYTNAAPALLVLCVAFFLKSIVGPTGATLLATGNSKIVMKINLGTVGLSILLNLCLIPILGLIGAAIATGAATAFQQFTMLLIVRREIRLQIWHISLIIYAIHCFIMILFVKICCGTYMKSIISWSVVGALYYMVALLGLAVIEYFSNFLETHALRAWWSRAG
jgi:O-antigen/teichoic acid export membrane protein